MEQPSELRLEKNAYDPAIYEQSLRSKPVSSTSIWKCCVRETGTSIHAIIVILHTLLSKQERC